MWSSWQIARSLADRLRARTAFAITEWIFLRALGLIYLCAFASLWPQVLGLMGSHGVAPSAGLLEAMRSGLGARAFYYAPSLFWLKRTDAMLLALCVTGCVFSILLALNWFSRIATIACFLLYLSLSSIGQPFLSFQWDALLLETGFIAIFSGAAWIVWAYRLLLFRLMFESGWVKLASHDPNWRNLHALRFHFMTQPLPNPIAYYVYRAPAGLLDAATAATLAIEFVAPVLLFCPGILRRIGTGLLIALQVLILLTGNYAFFNLLTIALCLWGFDAIAFARVTSVLRWQFPRGSAFRSRDVFRTAGNLAAAVLVALGILQLVQSLTPRTASVATRPLAWLQPFEIVNHYGLFAIMTTTRTEIILEGSDDQANWRQYEFPYKPGNTHRGLPWIAPYQPRLDWQMWFAALGDYQSNNWVGGLMYRILTAEPSVLKLLKKPPFARPPRYLRALAYQYDFTTPAERARTGAVWQRRLIGVWFGTVSLKNQ